jgi:hypothetical protein
MWPVAFSRVFPGVRHRCIGPAMDGVFPCPPRKSSAVARISCTGALGPDPATSPRVERFTSRPEVTIEHPRSSPASRGWWLDRRRHRYIPITDHTRDALEHPRRFRLAPADVHAICAAGPNFEHMRAVCIPLVASRGFLRIRWIPRQATLGWQFHGDPAGAIVSLRRFAARHGVGPATAVTFTNFHTGEERRALLGELLPGRLP